MSTLISLISGIVEDLICWIETGVVLFTNLLISGIGYIIGVILSALPNMPSLPTLPSYFTTGYHYAAYWFPVDYSFALGATLFTLWLAWIAIALILRWAKVVGGNA